jgi:L-asparaginase / beta-aspartyl-peptidase
MSAWSLALHGGAGAMPAHDYEPQQAHMAALLERGAALLSDGAAALDVVQAMVEELEACGFHVAGKGAAPNTAGQWELDAAIMDGAARRAGAVAALQGFLSPIKAARAVMQESPHVLIVGEGAAAFADARNLERVVNPAAYYVAAQTGLPDAGTVGAVARDTHGRLAAATSTGGTHGKLPGRVGDCPLIGAGTWADQSVAVSCTGVGEYFIRSNAAATIAALVRYKHETVSEAARIAIADVAAVGGQGGLIAVDAQGNLAAPFNTQGMKRALANSAGLREVKIFA